MNVWYAYRQNVLGIVSGDFITFKWNGKIEESFFPVLRDESDTWIYIGEL